MPSLPPPENAPFRDDELRVQIGALRTQRDGLVKQRDARQAELRNLRRFRWGWFVLAFVTPPVMIFSVLLVGALLSARP